MILGMSWQISGKEIMGVTNCEKKNKSWAGNPWSECHGKIVDCMGGLELCASLYFTCSTVENWVLGFSLSQ